MFDRAPIVKMLFDYGFEPEVNHYHAAAQRGQLQVLKELLAGSGVDVNTPLKDGKYNLLWTATKHKKHNLVEYLLSQGAKIPEDNLIAKKALKSAASERGILELWREAGYTEVEI